MIIITIIIITPKWGASLKCDHNLTVIKLKCIWNKKLNNETMKITCGSKMCKIITNSRTLRKKCLH